MPCMIASEGFIPLQRLGNCSQEQDCDLAIEVFVLLSILQAVEKLDGSFSKNTAPFFREFVHFDTNSLTLVL